MTTPAFDTLWGDDDFDVLWGDDATGPGRGVPSVTAQADATRVGPGPKNPGEHELHGVARLATNVFEHGVPLLGVPGAADFANPAGLVGDMAMLAGGTALGRLAGPVASRVLSIVKRAPGAALGTAKDVAMAASGSPTAKLRVASRVADLVRKKPSSGAPTIPGEFVEPPIIPEKPPVATAVRQDTRPYAGKVLGPHESVVEAVKQQRAEPKPVNWFKYIEPRVQPRPKAAGVDDTAMKGLLDRMRAAQPHEIGNVWGDAEIAMGMDRPAPDIEDLLRRSLRQAGMAAAAPIEQAPAMDLGALLRGSLQHVAKGGALNTAKATTPRPGFPFREP